MLTVLAWHKKFYTPYFLHRCCTALNLGNRLH
jgi:hypothetical protein